MEIKVKDTDEARKYAGLVTERSVEVAELTINHIIDPIRSKDEDMERFCVVYDDHFEIFTRTKSDFKSYYFHARLIDQVFGWADYYKYEGDYRS